MEIILKILFQFKKSICEYNWSICYSNLPIVSRIHNFHRICSTPLFPLFFQLQFYSHLNEMHSHKSMKTCTTPCKWHPSKGASHCLHVKQLLPKNSCDTTEDSQVLSAPKITDLIYEFSLFSLNFFLCFTHFIFWSREVSSRYVRTSEMIGHLFLLTAWER